MKNKIELGLQTLNDFVFSQTGEHFEEREKALISGALEGLTYSEIQQQKSILKGLTVEYISQYVAYHLWKKLNHIWVTSELADRDFKLGKNKLWHAIEIISNNRITTEEKIDDILPPKILEGKVLRDRYEIIEYLFERDLRERHYLACDRDYGNRFCSVVQLYDWGTTIKRKIERQVKVFSKLNKHPQIPQLLAYFQEDRYYYFVYEYIEGEPITNSLVAGKPWSEKKVIGFLRNMLAILEFIHHHNIIHRNLNPDSLIEQPDGKIIAIDFATVKEIKQDINSYLSQNSFAQGMTGYMPPEQLVGMIEPCSDIYAVGKIAIHALTGIHPRQLKIDRQSGNTIWRNQAQISSKLGEIIDKMVRYHFIQRYRSAREILEDLKKN